MPTTHEGIPPALPRFHAVGYCDNQSISRCTLPNHFKLRFSIPTAYEHGLSRILRLLYCHGSTLKIFQYENGTREKDTIHPGLLRRILLGHFDVMITTYVQNVLRHTAISGKCTVRTSIFGIELGGFWSAPLTMCITNATDRTLQPIIASGE